MGDDINPTYPNCSPSNFRLEGEQRAALEVECNRAIPSPVRALALDKACAK